MTQATATELSGPRERISLGVRLRRGFYRMRAKLLPRRWVIPWEMRENSRYYDRAIKAARARNASRDDVDALEAEASHFYWELEEELEMLESSRLLKQAAKYMLPKPDFHADPEKDPNWQQGTTFKPTWYLRREAMQEMRARIRAERKARREPFAEWVKILGGLGGILFLAERLIALARR